MNKRVELISPAGNLEKAITALKYGADSIYLGLKKFSLRNRADNFNFDELEKIFKITKKLNKNLYITLNVFLKDYEFDELYEYLSKINEIGVENLIISDIGVIYFINKNFKNKFNLTISSLANVMNSYTVEFFKETGIKRIILSKELSIDEIKEIKKRTDIQIEVFIHGALCLSYSGRCLLSEYFTGRSANRGDCAHPCRWEYILIEKKRNEPSLEIEEYNNYSLLLSSKDLCAIDYIPQLIEIGIDAFKIEGRMKSLYYTANTTRVYRYAIDCYYNGVKPDIEFLKNELNSVSHREYFDGFFSGYKIPTITPHKNYKREYKFIGYITKKIEKGFYELKLKNPLSINDEIEIILPEMKNIIPPKFKLYDEERNEVDFAGIHKNFYIKLDLELDEYSIIRSHL